MTSRSTAQYRRVQDALRKLEPEIRRAFTAAIQKAAGAIDEQALAAAIEAGDIIRAVDLLRVNQAVLFPLDEIIRAGYVAGGGLVSADLSKGLAGRFDFNGRHIRAENWMRHHGAELIEGIVSETLDMGRKVITDGLEQGVSHKAIARQITGRKVGTRRVGGFLGLNSDQTDSVIRARAILSDPDQIRDYFVKDKKTGRMKPRYKLSDRRFDAKVKKAIKEGRALTGKELDTVMEAHRNKALGYRGKVIAKNEAHTALAAGRDEAYRQVMDDPEVEAITKRWQHGLSREPRPDHQRMDGTVIDFDETFEMGDGTLMAHPHDPAGGAKHSIHCGCIAVHRIRMKRDIAPAPAPTPTPKGFDYQAFRGIKSVAQAEKYLIENGVTKVASLKGISPKGLSKAVGAAHEVTERFGLAPIEYMGPITRDTRYRYRKIKGANAAVYPQTGAMHLPTKFGDIKEAERQIESKTRYAERYETGRSAVLDASQRISEDVRARVDKMAEGDYTWSITMADGASERAKTMYHEYGHVLHLIDKTIGPKIDEFLKTEQPLADGWSLLVSEYGGSNEAEYIAETFAIYMSKPKAERFRIHPKLLEIYIEADQKNDD